MRLLIVALSASVVVCSCSTSGIDCGEPTKLASSPLDPAYLGAPLGPILVRNFKDDATSDVIGYWEPGRGTKVTSIYVRPVQDRLKLRGWRCSDGTPLRFSWSYPFALNSTPAPSAVFAEAGFEEPTVEALPTLPSDQIRAGAAPPYWLFPSAGKYMLELRNGNDVVGRAILLVPDAESK